MPIPCLTCAHNTYKGIDETRFVDCCHPITIAKTPRFADGDPYWVSQMTADVLIKNLDAFDCAAFEPERLSR